MNKITIAIFAVVFPLLAAQAQNGAVPSTQQIPANQAGQTGQPAQPAQKIAPGSVIPVQLSKTIDSKKVKPGDEVAAKVTQDMESQSGVLILAKDTTVIGHVTQAQTRSKDQKESEVGVAFDHAVKADGTDIHLPMSIQAVIVPVSAAPSGEAAGQPGSAPNSDDRASSPPATTPRPPITGNTQGVVGDPNLNLEASASTKDGSVISSTKSNVKLEGGSILLLRVN